MVPGMMTMMMGERDERDEYRVSYCIDEDVDGWMGCI